MERGNSAAYLDNHDLPTADISAPLRPISGAGRDCVEVASEDSFPASDAPGWTIVIGIGSPDQQNWEGQAGLEA
jgi:hypothetical protein